MSHPWLLADHYPVEDPPACDWSFHGRQISCIKHPALCFVSMTHTKHDPVTEQARGKEWCSATHQRPSETFSPLSVAYATPAHIFRHRDSHNSKEWSLQEAAESWVKSQGQSLQNCKMGFHSIPSMRQLHLHVISQVNSNTLEALTCSFKAPWPVQQSTNQVKTLQGWKALATSEALGGGGGGGGACTPFCSPFLVGRVYTCIGLLCVGGASVLPYHQQHLELDM